MRIVVDSLHAVVRPLFLKRSVKADDKALIAALDEPGFPAGKPHVGHFDLPAVHDLLFEESVLIADGKSHGGIILRRKPVKEACRKPAKSPVSKPRVGFFLVEVFQRHMEALERIGKRIVDPEIIDAVLERTPHQKFHAEIVDALRFRVLGPKMEFLMLFCHDIPDAHHDSLVDLFAGCFLRDYAEIARQLPCNEAVCLLFRQFAHECMCTSPEKILLSNKTSRQPKEMRGNAASRELPLLS